MRSIVIDTNILISAVGWQGNERRVLEKCLLGKCKLIMSNEIIDELTEVLKRPKFNFIPSIKKAELLKYVVQISKIVNIKERLEIIKEDPADNKILETAIAGEADYIISGDRHLLNIKKFRSILILKAKDFLDIHS